MDIVASEARSPVERMTLENLLRSEEITVKEEPLITTCLVPDLQRFVKEELWARTPPPPSLKKIEVIDLIDDDDDDDDQNRDHVGVNITPQTPLATDFLTVDHPVHSDMRSIPKRERLRTCPVGADHRGSTWNQPWRGMAAGINIGPVPLEEQFQAARDGVEEESRTTKFPPAFDSIEGNAEPRHCTMKQPDVSNSVMRNASVHPSLTAVEINNKASIAQEPVCSERNKINPRSQQSQTSTESNTIEEPQCLGPFVESSSVKCPKCSVTLTEYYQILDHSCIAEHISREEMKQKLKCCFCEKEYGSVRSLQKHIRTYIERTYVKCSVCGVRLTSVCSFKAHALTHTNQWPYRCDICGRGSVSELQLELHKTIHANEKSWMCDVCGAMFPNQLRLNGHKIVHSERKYECDLCFKKFRERYKVKKHKENVHSVRKKVFQCEDCNSSFTAKSTLKLHKEMKHSDNSSGERFICSVCNKEFRHRYVFNRHMNMHKSSLENVIYTCDICKRNFARKGSLTRHILEHNGKQFSCSHCGMLFTQTSSVKRHMLKVHGTDT